MPRGRLVGAVVILFAAGCEQVVGLDGAISSYDELNFCSCQGLTSQDALLPDSERFALRCETGLDTASKDQFEDFIAQECNSCPVTSADVGDCYATLTKAAEVGEPCTAHADCRSLACCINVSLTSDEPGTCCESCRGCSMLDQATDADDVCVDLAKRLDDESQTSCESCAPACDQSLTLVGLKACALCIEMDCPASCTRWEDRPIKDESEE